MKKCLLLEVVMKNHIQKTVKTDSCDDVEEWCKENNVHAMYCGFYSEDSVHQGAKYHWFIDNDDSRVRFLLRWA